jgi:ParB family chromosome partitioning protein
MARKSGLGRGLDALITDEGLGAVEGGVYQIPVDVISRNPRQPRAEISSESLEELISSIRVNGILQPLILSPGEQPGTYTLIAGERRLQAARQAGLQKVPALVRSASEQQYLELALVENLQRTDLPH